MKRNISCLMKKGFFSLMVFSCFPFLFSGMADDEDFSQKARRFVLENKISVLEEDIEFLSIPNVAADEENIRRNAVHILRMLERRGIRARLLEERGAPPIVYGEWLNPGAERKVVIYAHYDGQPVDSSQWRSDPWTPELRDGPLEQGGEVIPLSSFPAAAAVSAHPVMRSALRSGASGCGRSSSLRRWWRKSWAGDTPVSRSTARSKRPRGKRPSAWANT